MTILTCEMFTRLLPHFEEAIAREPTAGITYEDWCEHMHTCAACSDAVLAHRTASWGVDASAFPCIHMAYRTSQTCPLHEDRAECPDLVIGYDEVFDEYSLIKDGVSIAISFCPWCGVKLPPSQRDRWFTELEGLLGTSPLAAPQNVPTRFRSREWRG